MSETQNCTITDVNINFDRDYFTCLWVHVEGDGWGVGIGGYVAGKRDQPADSAFLVEQIRQLMNCFEVESLADLKGMPARAVTTGWGGTCKKLGHFTKDQWVDMDEIAETYHPKAVAA